MTQAILSNEAASEPQVTTSEFSENDAAEMLLKRFLPQDGDATKPSSATENVEEDERADDADANDETSAVKPEAKAKAEGDDAEGDSDSEEVETVVKIKVGEEEHEVPVSKLTRLYGQEASLTKKSMEVAEQRKGYEAKLAEQQAVTNALMQRAQERLQPYANLDFNLLAAEVGQGRMTQEEYVSLRQAAQAAYEDVQFLSQHSQAFMQQLQAGQQQELRSRAIEAVKVLSGPEDQGGITGWGDQLYNDIRSFAISQGAPAEVVNTITDPWAIRMIHNAMLYERGRSKSADAIKTVKVNKTPKKIVKTTSAPKSARGLTPQAEKAEERFAKSGSTDDAAEMMLARWAVASDND